MSLYCIRPLYVVRSGLFRYINIMKFHEVLHLLALFVFLDNGSRDGEKFDRASNGKFVKRIHE